MGDPTLNDALRAILGPWQWRFRPNKSGLLVALGATKAYLASNPCHLRPSERNVLGGLPHPTNPVWGHGPIKVKPYPNCCGDLGRKST